MPATQILFYREADRCPPIEWLESLDANAREEMDALLVLLSRYGHELGATHVKSIGRGGLYELRGRVGKVQYRMLFFYFGQAVTVVSHGFSKESKLPEADIKRALNRKARFEANPGAHAATW